MHEKRTLLLASQSLNYTLRRHKRARRVSITVEPGGEIIVTIPFSRTHITAEKFLKQRLAWISRAVKQMTSFEKILPARTKQHYQQHKETARILINEKLKYWNQFYNFTYHKVSIRNQSSRWGSCSAEGNLNFSYRLLFLPDSLVDYIVVHELCHLKYRNHQARFWNLVSQTIPDHKKRRARLKKIA